MRASWGLLAAFALGGCALVDQTTFAPSPDETATAATPFRADPRVALLTVSYVTPEPAYQDVLRYAVRAAETRAPGVQYDVIAILPDAADAAEGQRRATEVMRAILAQGVPPSRVRLGLRTGAAGPQEVRIYVR